MRILAALILTALTALPALAVEWAAMSDKELNAELNRVESELTEFRELQAALGRSERSSNNTARAAVIDDLQQHMIDAVVRRENIVGMEHTIIRHGQQVGGPTEAAEVGTPNANKETRRRMRKGTSQKPDAFLRLAWMQQQVMGGERIYRPAIEKQPGAFENYASLVKEFGGALQDEYDGMMAELAKREKAAAAEAAGDTLLDKP